MSVDPRSRIPPTRDSAARDSALRRLSLTTRWLIAGSVALTGALSEAAAHAFPGKTVKIAAHEKTLAKHQPRPSSQGSASSLEAPAQVPRAAPEAHTEATPEGSARATPEHSSEAAPEARPEAHTEAAPEQRSEATPEQHSEATPEQHSEASPERRSEAIPEQHSESSGAASEPAQASPESPVVSGGS